MNLRTDDLRISRRRALGSLGVGLGAVLASACSGAPASTGTSSGPASSTGATANATSQPAAAGQASGGTVNLRLHIRTGPYGDVWTQRGKDFEQQHPNVKTAIEPYSSDVLSQKIQTMAAAGTVGDAYFVPTVWAEHYLFFSSGVARELTDYANADKVDWSQWYKTAADQVHLQGKVVAMLDGASPGRAGLYYNKNLFKQAGQNEPNADWNLDQLVAAAKALTKDGVYGFHSLHRDSVELLIWLRSFGGDLYSQDGKKATLTTPESLQGITWVWNTLYQWKCSLPATSDTGSADQSYGTVFAAGKLAMFNSGTWDANTVEATKIDWGLVPLAKGPVGKRGSMAEANTCQVTAASKNPDVAWQWAKWISDHDSGKLHVLKGVTPGGRPDVYGDPDLDKQYPYLAVFKTIFEEAEPYVIAANFHGKEAAQAVIQGMDPVWLNASKVDTGVADQVNQKVQQIIDQPT
jgi:multiple sugar transport system substrate-binding protein